MVKPQESQKKDDRKKSANFAPIGDLFAGFQLEDKGGYITQEFQDFGYRMAMALDDPGRVSLYMRLAKKDSRMMLEQALSFVSDARDVKNKAALFMWKLKDLRAQKKKALAEKNHE